MSNILLADVGGTHVRFGISEGQDVHNCVKWKASDFKDLAHAIDAYIKDINGDCQHVRIATAAWPDEDGVYRFAKNKDWGIDFSAIKGLGLSIDDAVNDFTASSYGALYTPVDNHISLKQGGSDSRYPVIVCGPGTGLGLSYALPQGQDDWHIQTVFGGFMPVAPQSREQFEICRIAQDYLDRVLVYEDLCSGRGLPNLYRAVCDLHGYNHESLDNPSMILDNIDQESYARTLELFHEFLGLFIHNCVLTCHAYGGVYLHGGLIDRLHERDFFDYRHMLKYIFLKHVPQIDHILEKLPVYYVQDPYVALRGLLRINNG